MSDHQKADDVTTGERMVLVPANFLDRLAKDAGAIAARAEHFTNDTSTYWWASNLERDLRDLAGTKQ